LQKVIRRSRRKERNKEEFNIIFFLLRRLLSTKKNYNKRLFLTPSALENSILSQILEVLSPSFFKGNQAVSLFYDDNYFK
jgi:hypothetical protein